MLPLASSSPRKRKHRDDSVTGPSPKKHKKEKRPTEFILVHASLVVPIPPVFASNPVQGVEEMLDSMIMRYIPSLRGVVLTHSNLRFLMSNARIQDDCPYLICNIGFDATVWSPRVGQKLTGEVILCSPDHISLLIDRTFNVSIPRHHIPRGEWTFEWGPAENDPEFGAAALEARKGSTTTNQNDALEEDVEMAADGELVGDKGLGEKEEPAENLGRWVHAVTGEQLGPTLEFTVVGLTIANQMLSLVGSIQPDPFSPEHVPPAQETQPRRTEAEDVEETAAEDTLVESYAVENGEAGSSEPELDTLAELGKKAKLAKTTAEEAKKSDKKTKRKPVDPDKADKKARKKKKQKTADN